MIGKGAKFQTCNVPWFREGFRSKSRKGRTWKVGRPEAEPSASWPRPRLWEVLTSSGKSGNKWFKD